MVRANLTNLIKKAIKKAQKEKKLPKFQISEILIKKPENPRFGDYATNIAMQIARITKKKPMETANIIKSQIPNNSKFLEKIEIVLPGFINFFLSREFLQKQVGEILKQKVHPVKCRSAAIPRTAELFNRVNLEFISANPTGPLHIGQGRGAFFGDCLANVLEKAGYKVVREYFINDAKNSNQIKELGKTFLGEGNVYLNNYLSLIINQCKSKIKKFKDGKEAGYFLAQIIQKDNKNFIEKKLKIKIDNWISEEKDLYKKNKIEKIYRYLKKKNLIYKKQGAEWLKTTKFGDKQDWVLIRTTGEPTYLLSDIAYHKDKIDRKFSKIIDIWGADHQGHITKIKAAAKILKYKGSLDILICQVVRLKSGLKLSKRKGDIITLEQLIDEVGLDVARFFYLTKSLDTQMEFDMELAKEQSEKNPVYYIQYAHARIHSILAKSKIQSQNPKLELLNHTSELNLIKQLIKFPEVVEDTAQDYQIQRIPQYAHILATAFHQFYRDCKVLTEDKKLSQARLTLISATKIVLKNTLDLMGVSAPKKM
jgi:arginyl-tRNA synthetase